MPCRNYSGNFDLACAPENVSDGTLVLQASPKPGPVCSESSWRGIRAYHKAGYIISAWGYAFRDYADVAIIRHTSEDFYEILKGLLPFLEQAILFVAGMTTAGAGVGAAGGSLFFGIGALPGAGFGAEVGLEAALIILDILGVGFLLVYIKDHLVEMGNPIMQGTKIAVNSCGSPGELKHAGQLLADGFGVFCSLLLQAAAAYLLHKGFKAGREKLGSTKLGWRFANYVSRVARRDYCLEKLGLVNEPELVKQRVQTVVDFIDSQAPDRALDSIVNDLQGIDLNSDLEVVELKPGTKLMQNVHPDGIGRWYTDGGFAPEDLGIDSSGRTYERFTVKRTVKALKSRSKSTRDFWTTRKTEPVKITPKTLSGEPTGEAPKIVQRKVGVDVRGGGRQYYVPGWKEAIGLQ